MPSLPSAQALLAVAANMRHPRVPPSMGATMAPRKGRTMTYMDAVVTRFVTYMVDHHPMVVYLVGFLALNVAVAWLLNMI